LTSVDTVIFDLGGVLIDWNPKHLYRKIFDDEEKMNWFLSEITTPDWNEEQDAGRPVAVATEILVRQHPSYKKEIEAFYDRWPEMLGGPITGTVDIFKSLKEANTHRIYALTNWSAETFPVAQARYDFLEWFEGILVSGEEQLKKPDPRIYQLILDRYNITAENAVFIDDNLRNIKAAINCGIHGIHFESPGQLKNSLLEYGITI
jgi:2-haloacid dehalogenase